MLGHEPSDRMAERAMVERPWDDRVYERRQWLRALARRSTNEAIRMVTHDARLRSEPGFGSSPRSSGTWRSTSERLADHPGRPRSSCTRAAIPTSPVEGLAIHRRADPRGTAGRAPRRDDCPVGRRRRAHRSTRSSGSSPDPSRLTGTSDRILATVLFTDIVASTRWRPSSATRGGKLLALTTSAPER